MWNEKLNLSFSFFVALKINFLLWWFSGPTMYFHILSWNGAPELSCIQYIIIKIKNSFKTFVENLLLLILLQKMNFMVKWPIFMILTLSPNDGTPWKNELNDDHDDYGTLSTMNDLTMMISIDHGAERSSNDLHTLISDQIFSWWPNGMTKISEWNPNMIWKENFWSLVEGCKCWN